MADILEQLVRDHGNIKQVLQALEQQGRSFEQDTDTELDLLIEITDYLRNYVDIIHHQREDAIFYRVIEKDEHTARIMRNLVQEHEQAAALSAELTEEVDRAFKAEQVQRRDRLPEIIGRYVEFNRRHMENEENSGFPLARRVLDSDDWDAIEHSQPADIPREFETLLRQEYRALYEHIRASETT